MPSTMADTDTISWSHISQLLTLIEEPWNANDPCLQDFYGLPGGKLLIDWLSSQISTHSTRKFEQYGHRDNDQSTNIAASLRDVLLEAEEYSTINSIESSSNENKVSLPMAPANYTAPSRLKEHTGYIDDETLDIHREVNELRAKLFQVKDACQKCAQSTGLLRSAVGSLATTIGRYDDELSDLSISADAAISSIVITVEKLLRDLGFCETSTEHNADAPAGREELDSNPISLDKALFLQTQTQLSKIVGDLQTYSKGYRQLREDEKRKTQNLECETVRVGAALKAGQDAMMTKNIPSLRFDQHLLSELITVLDLLEKQLKGNDTSPINHFANFLSSVDEGYHTSSPKNTETSVEELMIHAWKMDQVARINSHEEKLNESLSSLDVVLPILERLHRSLLCIMRCTQNAEVTSEILGEELREINVEHSTNFLNQTHSGMDHELECGLKSILSDWKVGTSSLPPLEKEDVLKRLRLLKSASENSETSQKAWAYNTIRDCFMRPLHPLLTDIYTHSPLNTSPPFEFSDETRDLNTRTRTMTRQLQALSKSLEDDEVLAETYRKDDYLKRLKGFIDKSLVPKHNY